LRCGCSCSSACISRQLPCSMRQRETQQRNASNSPPACYSGDCHTRTQKQHR
jgi:hypothetical protein